MIIKREKKEKKKNKIKIETIYRMDGGFFIYIYEL